jgi:hypothetical protein
MEASIDRTRTTEVTIFELPPIWGSRKTVRRWFGLSQRRLDEMVLEGWVRSVKFGGRSATRLFRLEDVDEALKMLARGSTPRRPGLRGRRRR